jgi:4'-phosphopantetheinyl transferase
MRNAKSESTQAPCKWPIPPEQLFLGEKEVHVWFASLDDPDLSVLPLEQQLSSAEHEQASRFKFEKDRTRYVITHALLRSILSLYLQVDPKDLILTTSAKGKPELAPMPHKDTVQFNMSHSHDTALIAVSRSAEIGIDLEYVDESFAFDEIIQRFFSPAEGATLHSLPPTLRRQAFFRCWTCKEALVKAKGTGLGSALDEITISQTAGNTLVLRNVDPDWSLTELTPAPGYVGALGVQGHGWRLKCWQWQAQAATTL